MLSNGLNLVSAFQICVVSWASARRPFTNGEPSTAGMDVSMMSRMKELEEENRRLKKM
jgi:hypothetical protein